MPAISIIIPMYGVEKYLRRCLDSVQNQTFTDWQAEYASFCKNYIFALLNTSVFVQVAKSKKLDKYAEILYYILVAQIRLTH